MYVEESKKELGALTSRSVKLHEFFARLLEFTVQLSEPDTSRFLMSNGALLID